MTLLERNLLIESYLPLAKKLAFQKKKQLPQRTDIDDLISAAYLGLLDAAIKFDASKMVSFGLYAKLRIMGEIQDFIRKSCKNINDISLDDHNEDGNSFASLVADKTNKDYSEEIEEVTKHLNSIDKKILLMYYVDELSLKEIGFKIGVSESRVSQLLKQSKANAKETEMVFNAA